MIAIAANIIDRNSGIYYYMNSARMMREAHLHDGFCEVMVMLGGHLTHSAEGETCEKRAGDLIFMPEGTVHALSGRDEGVLFLNMAILPTVLALAVQYLGLSEIPTRITYASVPQAVRDYLLWNHKNVLGGAEEEQRVSAARNSLALLLPYCCAAKPVRDWFGALLAQMRKPENFQAGVSRMQQLSFCSPSHLCRTCRARIGMTPTQYIEKTRIDYAAHLLRHTSFSVRDVAEECGFGNLGYFYRCFERRMGLPPKRFREQLDARNRREGIRVIDRPDTDGAGDPI